jgi:hypothetical protein
MALLPCFCGSIINVGVARKKLTAPTFKIRKERTRKSSDSIDMMSRLSRSDSSVAGNTDFLAIFLIAANAPGGSTPDTSPKRPQNHNSRKPLSLIWKNLPCVPGFLQHHLSIFLFCVGRRPFICGFCQYFWRPKIFAVVAAAPQSGSRDSAT